MLIKMKYTFKQQQLWEKSKKTLRLVSLKSAYTYMTYAYYPLNSTVSFICCCLNVYFILISITYNKMMIYIMVQYATLKKKILQIKLIYQNMNIIYENNVIMIIAIDLQFINQSKKYYLDTSKYNSKNHLEIQKQS